MAAEDWEQFFDDNAAPTGLRELEATISSFLARQADRRVCLVTSGGTTVPLELNTVRFVDNFSAGTRGSASAEQLLDRGLAVIFLHRQSSLQPFCRHVEPRLLLAGLEESGSGELRLAGELATGLTGVVRAAREAAPRLLSIPFTSLASYLWLLRATSQLLAATPSPALLYLAAAVSDFYIPGCELPEHKLQSSEGPPAVQLRLVPKMLRPLVQLWAPAAFVITFKLETDPDLLLTKSRAALAKYGHQLVIGNLLATRTKEVVLVGRDRTERVSMEPEELSAGQEIEQKIVRRLLELYEAECGACDA